MLAKVYIAIGLMLVFAASAGLNLHQHGRIQALELEAQQAGQINQGNQVAIQSLQAAQATCLAKIEVDEQRRIAALSARDEAYADLAVKYDQAKANLTRVLDNECKDWASEPVCVATILGE